MSRTCRLALNRTFSQRPEQWNALPIVEGRLSVRRKRGPPLGAPRLKIFGHEGRQVSYNCNARNPGIWQDFVKTTPGTGTNACCMQIIYHPEGSTEVAEEIVPYEINSM